jgi:hypothetical protein
MLFLIIFIIAAQLLVFGSAIRWGDRTIRQAAIWISANIAIHTCLSIGGVASPTLHLINDGIYATGLLPLAFFSVSPTIGVLALLACGSFVLQSFYLLAEKPTDWTFTHVNDAINAGYLLTFVAGTIASVRSRRRERKETTGALAAA